jgi:hypothetical protein
MTDFLIFLNQIGFWSIVYTFVIIGGFVAGLRLIFGSTSRIRDLNFYITYTRDPQKRFPLTLDFEIRNLSHHFCAISSAYFKFDKAKPGPYAHGDSVSHEYEIKFRRSPDDVKSEVACLLRHRDIVTSYIPLDQKQTDEELKTLSDKRQFGTLYCNVVYLSDRPRLRRLKLKITGIVENEAAQYANLKSGTAHSPTL